MSQHASRNMHRALITGGAGFIGSHLAEQLLAKDAWVTVIDDLSTGNLDNLKAAQSNPRFKFIQAKVSACADLPELAAEADQIFHLAAAVGVELVVKSPVRVIETNLHETEVLLRAATACGTPVLLASTSEVYGKSAKEVFTEEDDLLIGPPTHARWSYACSKLMDEFLALAYAKERGLPVVIARLFNTVGPRQTGRYGMVLPRFIAAAQRGRAASCVWRRHPVALFLLCAGHRGGAAAANVRPGGDGPDFQHWQHGGSFHC